MKQPAVKVLEVQTLLDRDVVERHDPPMYRLMAQRQMVQSMGQAAVEAGGVWYTDRGVEFAGVPERMRLTLHVVDKDDLWWFDRGVRARFDGRWYVRWTRRLAWWLMKLADRWEGQL